MAVKQTAGREQLGGFAPKFAELNDDVLFGEVWNREDRLSLRDRSIVTVVSLMSMGMVDSSFQYHLESARKNGVSRTEIAEILTHAAFYAGWPKAWAAFRMAKEVWKEDDSRQHGGLFGVGEPNTAYAAYFTGRSYLRPVVSKGLGIGNVTFEPGCRNWWHIHHADQGGGQILLCTEGTGIYQEWGKQARILHPGDAVEIPAGVRHWHGALKDSWFTHLSVEVPGVNTSAEWLEPVSDQEYEAAHQSGGRQEDSDV